LHGRKTFARSLNLNSQSEWYTYTKSGKLPLDILVDARQSYKDKGWTNWGVCLTAVVGLAVFLKGTDIFSDPSRAGLAIGSVIGVWGMGGIAPVVAHFARKSSRKTLLKTWIVGW